MEIHRVPIESIHHRQDARPRSDGALAELGSSIDKIGLINPIRVRMVSDGYEVVAGSHRLQAIDSLGWREVPCIVTTDDDIAAELAMIDENLCRAELSPADRAKQTARRKAIYLELHPETAQHVAGGKARQETASDKLSFAAATAEVTGRDQRTVQRDAERGEKVIDEVLDMIRGTKLDTGTYLDKIKLLPPSEQVVAAKRDLVLPQPTGRSNFGRDVKVGGIAARFASADTSSPQPIPSKIFERFVSLADEIEALPIPELLHAAGRQRSVLGQRASGLADRMSEIMEALDQ
ncbi:ParB/RepB/Spo0J family partition protein [Aerobium aerolatum]|uniref:ParB/RepB/Spo0J family partition protein n=1 Tax=Aquamicrobium aerolatum DSM 21857 TaxID=1121003 RepID=A0A1I3SRN6_9HYPH|nr:ParB N-terminal domain-containing protein [Aquamicrobium aerolatum]SFJ61514.1 ParB/RepB/Spo0J family partition protein [Aquamicrobium aerolatum DSM 21857]